MGTKQHSPMLVICCVRCVGFTRPSLLSAVGPYSFAHSVYLQYLEHAPIPPAKNVVLPPVKGTFMGLLADEFYWAIPIPTPAGVWVIVCGVGPGLCIKIWCVEFTVSTWSLQCQHGVCSVNMKLGDHPVLNGCRCF